MGIIKKLGDIFYSFFNAKEYLTSDHPNIDAGKENCIFRGKVVLKPGFEKIKFGNYCAIGEHLRIVATNHDYNLPALQKKFYKKHFNKYPGSISKGPVTIGSDVWFGDNVTVLGGVTIGHGACIATGSIVTKDVPPYTIAGGIPAKPIKKRFNDNIIDFLLQLKWWHWPDERIKRNKDFFHTDLSKASVEELKNLIKE